MPTVSVTVLGLAAGGAVLLVRRSSAASRLFLAILGAWVGFLAGALVGVVVDVVLGTGFVLAITGHAAAIAVAVVAALCPDGRVRAFRPQGVETHAQVR